MNATNQTVVLYGDSVVMSSIGASCRQAGLEVVSLDTHQSDPAEQLQQLSPDVILYDLAHPPADFVLKSLTQDPKRLLIGVDLDRDCMLVLSGQRERAVTTSDLVRVIETWGNSTPAQPRWQMYLDHLRKSITARLTALRASSRRQKLAFALAAITVCSVVAVLLLPGNSHSNATLAGTAVGRFKPELGVAFAGGILLGALLLALALRWGHSRSQSKVHHDKIEEQEGGLSINR